MRTLCQILALTVCLSALRAENPPFRVGQDQEDFWLITPQGERFFSLGVCCLNQGTSREKDDLENPSYAAWRHYSTPKAWADASLQRLRSWRFTTAGGWSDFAALRESPEQHLWLTPVLHLGSTVGAPWLDMWDEKLLRRMEQLAREKILPLRDDPRLLGYYSDNELGWWNATLWKFTLEHEPSSQQRQRLLRLLRETYENSWEKLLTDFEPVEAGSWEGLEQGGMLYRKPGGAGMAVMRRFLGLLAERYYQLTHDMIREFDSRALILGDRYQSFYYPEVAKTAAAHVNLVSTNLNAAWNDGTFPRFQLDTLHALTKKPILISEFYMAAKENRSRNRNTHGVFPAVTTQAERAEATRTTLRALARLGYVVGADWFQFSDEPRHGRADGENYNFGLVDIHDEPYAELCTAFAELDATRLKAEPRVVRAQASQGAPPAPADPFGQWEATRALKTWDRERGFVPPESPAPLADLYICWSPQALYLGLLAWDIAEEAYYHDVPVPKVDRALWTVEINGGPTIRARVGSGREALVNHPDVRVEGLSGLNLNVKNIAAMELPARVLGKARWEAGNEVDLSAKLESHGRAYEVTWKAKIPLSR